ncbi:MAG: thioesterase domain-containing protein, partial [Planctomycetota bacterium]
EMARDYTEAIQQHQPRGPYHLAGWSTGGITALAVAERLEAAGETVALVGMFDTPPTSVYDDVDTNDDAAFLVSVLDFAARFKGLKATGVSKADLAILPKDEQFATVLEKAHAAGLAPKDVDETYVRRLVAVGEALVVATREGELKLPAAPVAFFGPTDDTAFADVEAHEGSNAEAWQETLGDRLTKHTAPGDHFTMMSGEGAAAIAAVLSQVHTSRVPSSFRRVT